MKFFVTCFMCIMAASCTRQVLKEGPSSSEPRTVVRVEGDTATYVLEFADRRELRRFTDQFEKFVKKYDFGSLTRDTVDNYVVIRTRPDSGASKRDIDMARVESPAITEEEIRESREQTHTQVPDLPPPGYGGSATIYSPRGFLDATLLSLVTPHTCDDSVPNHRSPWLRVETAGRNRIKVTFTDRIINGTGQQFSAFDLSEAWNGFIKAQPAEGRALFSGVRGIDEFIRGGEVLVPGIQVSDPKTVVVQFAPGADSVSFVSLCAPRLIPSTASLGSYFIKRQEAAAIDLQANLNHPSGRPFLDRCRIVLGKDTNPLLSFSLNRYDIVMLNSVRDLAFARDRLRDSADLYEMPADRYFLAINIPSPEIRRTITSAVRPEDILSQFVKSEGNVIATIESDTPPAHAPRAPGLQQQIPPDKPLTVLIRADDPVSVRTGEKLLADLSRAGIACVITALTAKAYETALVDRSYDITVGWVPQRVVTDPAERLRLASIWFNGERREEKRIEENYQISLFSVNNFALVKKHLSLYVGKLAGVYSKASADAR